MTADEAAEEIRIEIGRCERFGRSEAFIDPDALTAILNERERLREALAALLACGTHDPARKHPDESPAKGRWAVITAPSPVVDAARAALEQTK